MGIQGLLPALDDITLSVHMSRYTGRKVAVDTYCWLHRGAYACAEQLCLAKPSERNYNRLIDFVMKRVDILLANKVKPIMVFDGANLPMKQMKEHERAMKRQEAQSKAMLLKKKGNHSEARKMFVKALDISEDMAWRVIQRLKLKGIPCIVAPYEADSQLAFLSINKMVDAVISEDSDLLVYGCRRVIFKLDHEGRGHEICLKNLSESLKFPIQGLSHEQFRLIAILSGCDYVQSLPGIGLKKALKLVQEHKTLAKVLRRIRFDATCVIPVDYEDNVRKAMLTFKYQKVFDPATKEITHLHSLSSSEIESIKSQLNIDNLDFLGPETDPNVSVKKCLGDLNPQKHTGSMKQEISIEEHVQFSSKFFQNPMEKPESSTPSFVLRIGQNIEKGFGVDIVCKASSRVQEYMKDACHQEMFQASDSEASSWEGNSSQSSAEFPHRVNSQFTSPFISSNKLTQDRKTNKQHQFKFTSGPSKKFKNLHSPKMNAFTDLSNLNQYKAKAKLRSKSSASTISIEKRVSMNISGSVSKDRVNTDNICIDAKLEQFQHSCRENVFK